jgi:sulfur carrier protein
MTVTVNGQPQTLAEGWTVSQLLKRLQIRPERIVVEVNLKILKRHEHAMTVLREGDQVEIVRFVGGGAEDGEEADHR